MHRVAYVCPFPGCGRKFNVNSNMRRHFRNHTSSSRHVAATPYTYPLTNTPRALPTATQSLRVDLKRDTLPPLRPRAWTVTGSNSSQYTDSDDDEESYNRRRIPQSAFDGQFDVEVRETVELVDRLRLRSHSSPGVRPTPIRHRSPHASACNVPGCHYPVIGGPRCD